MDLFNNPGWATALGMVIGAAITALGSYWQARKKVASESDNNEALTKLRQTEQLLEAQQALISTLMDRVSKLELALQDQRIKCEEEIRDLREFYDKRIEQLEQELEKHRRVN